MKIAVGKFSGTGIAQSVTIADTEDGTSFQPKLGWLISNDSGIIVYKQDTFGATESIRWDAVAVSTTSITAFNADGFSVGTDAVFNGVGDVTYYLMLGTDDTLLETGSYTGNGVDDRIISTVQGWELGFVLVKRFSGTNQAAVCHFGTPQTGSVPPSGTGFQDNASSLNSIQQISTGQFQVGTDASVNTDTLSYHWFAFRNFSGESEGTGAAVTAFYDAVGADNQVILYATLNPTQARFLMVRHLSDSTGTIRAAFKTSTKEADDGDSSWAWGAASAANIIQDMDFSIDPLDAQFQIGTANEVNKSGINYAYLAIGKNLVTAASTGTAVVDEPTGYAVYILPETPYTVYKSQVAISERLKMLQII